MSTPVVTVVDARIDPSREGDLREGYHRMIEETPDGLLRSELLRGQDGAWRIQTTWRDLAALQAMRASGTRPAALALLESVGAEPSHAVLFTLEAVVDVDA